MVFQKTQNKKKKKKLMNWTSSVGIRTTEKLVLNAVDAVCRTIPNKDRELCRFTITRLIRKNNYKKKVVHFFNYWKDYMLMSTLGQVLCG